MPGEASFYAAGEIEKSNFYKAVAGQDVVLPVYDILELAVKGKKGREYIALDVRIYLPRNLGVPNDDVSWLYQQPFGLMPFLLFPPGVLTVPPEEEDEPDA